MNDLKPPRAWHKKEKKMFPVDALMWREGKLNLLWLLDEDQQVQSAHPSDVILLMPTGLRDKNGKEIYEGDVIKWIAEFGTAEYPDERELFEEVRFEGGAYQTLSSMPESEFEVIGNVYENPDLLGETK